MDCPICYELISKETGLVTTSCGHTFHFKCLNTWYWRQTQTEDARESCPCCRKEPCEFERASTVTEESSEYESEEEEDQEQEQEPSEWIRVGPRRWIVPSDESDRLRILAQVAEEHKQQEFYIPPYNGEAHALWNLRTLFDLPTEPLTKEDKRSLLDTAKYVRRRRRSFGRTFWSHLGTLYNLKEIDGYKTD